MPRKPQPRKNLSWVIDRLVFKSKMYFLSDEKFLAWKYEKKLGTKPNLENPVLFTEKIQWLKLHYKKPITTLMADKYGVKDLINLIIEEDILIPTWDFYTDVDDIKLENLPDSFILKANHGSGWNVICYDKKTFDLEPVKRKFKKELKINYFPESKEWTYKDIAPGVICELLILDSDGQPPSDYKFLCFNGEPKFVQVDYDRFSKHSRFFYDLNWELQDLSNGPPTPEKEGKKPENFERMIEIARKLSKGFPFVRVDLYNVEGKIYFGELTFYPGSGFIKFEPPAWEKKLGEMIDLSSEKCFK